MNCQSERSRRLFNMILLVFDYAQTGKNYNHLRYQPTVRSNSLPFKIGVNFDKFFGPV